MLWSSLPVAQGESTIRLYMQSTAVPANGPESSPAGCALADLLEDPFVAVGIGEPGE